MSAPSKNKNKAMLSSSSSESEDEEEKKKLKEASIVDNLHTFHSSTLGKPQDKAKLSEQKMTNKPSLRPSCDISPERSDLQTTPEVRQFIAKKLSQSLDQSLEMSEEYALDSKKTEVKMEGDTENTLLIHVYPSVTITSRQTVPVTSLGLVHPEQAALISCADDGGFQMFSKRTQLQLAEQLRARRLKHSQTYKPKPGRSSSSDSSSEEERLAEAAVSADFIMKHSAMKSYQEILGETDGKLPERYGSKSSVEIKIRKLDFESRDKKMDTGNSPEYSNTSKHKKKKRKHEMSPEQSSDSINEQSKETVDSAAVKKKNHKHKSHDVEPV